MSEFTSYLKSKGPKKQCIFEKLSKLSVLWENSMFALQSNLRSKSVNA